MATPAVPITLPLLLILGPSIVALIVLYYGISKKNEGAIKWGKRLVFIGAIYSLLFLLSITFMFCC